MDRRKFAKTLVCVTGGMVLPSLVRAQTALPSLIKIVVPFSPGGSNDVFARALAQQLSQELNVNCIVENKAGAGGAIGATQVARSTPDGSTLLLTSNSMITNFVVQANPLIDPISAFTHIAILNKGPSLLIVSNTSKHNDFPSLIEAIKRGEITNYGSAGIGSSAHLAAEMLNYGLGSNVNHIPYRGMANVAVDLAGNSLDFVITTAASVSGQLSANHLKAIAVTSPMPSKFFENLKPIADQIPQYDVEAWWGVFAPNGTPAPLVELLNQKINEISRKPAMASLYKQEATSPVNMGLEEIKQFLIAEQEKWSFIAKSRSVQPV